MCDYNDIWVFVHDMFLVVFFGLGGIHIGYGLARSALGDKP